MDQLADTSDGDEAWLENIVLREAMKNLTERERKIIQLRFYRNKTQMEIAEEIGISQAQVSRLEKATLEKIKKQLWCLCLSDSDIVGIALSDVRSEFFSFFLAYCPVLWYNEEKRNG